MNRPSASTPAYTGESLGGMFLRRREERKIPIEQAARETRIRVRRLQDMENDDLSEFSHPSYARLFMQDYARYLGIPAEEVGAFLPESGSYGGEGYEYLNEIPAESTMWRVARRIQPRRRLLPALTALVLVTFMALGGFQIWRMARNLDRIGGEPTVTVEKQSSAVVSGTSPQTAESGVPSAGETVEAEVFSSSGERIEAFIREDRELLLVRGLQGQGKESSPQNRRPRDL